MPYRTGGLTLLAGQYPSLAWPARQNKGSSLTCRTAPANMISQTTVHGWDSEITTIPVFPIPCHRPRLLGLIGPIGQPYTDPPSRSYFDAHQLRRLSVLMFHTTVSLSRRRPDAENDVDGVPSFSNYGRLFTPPP